MLAVMLAMQKEKVDILHYYDMRMGPSCCGNLFDCEERMPNHTYFVFHMFNSLYKLGTEVDSASDDSAVYVGAAANEKRAALVMANTKAEAVEVELSVLGADFTDADVLRIDRLYRYTLTGEQVKDGKITLPPYGCAEIRFYL